MNIIETIIIDAGLDPRSWCAAMVRHQSAGDPVEARELARMYAELLEPTREIDQREKATSF